MDLLLRSRRVLTPSGMREAILAVAGERISAVLSPAELPPGAEVTDLGDAVVMPGLVDTHAHVNEPGRTEWEGFATATRAAAAGGITTLVDMPLNSIPATTTLAALRAKMRAALDQAFIDHGFWGGVVPGNEGQLEPMLDAGVAGFKAFLVHSGVDDFPMAVEADLRRAMPILAKATAPLLVHAEIDLGGAQAGDPRLYRTYLSSRPSSWEVEAVSRMVALCREYRCPVHVVHLSAADALGAAARARSEGLPFTLETCPHYLTVAAEEIPDGRTEFKCAPPIRERENRERLWKALGEETIDLVVSDHSPCTPALKLPDTGDFLRAWGGIASLQLGLPLVWTGARRRGFTLEHLARWMCERPARLAGFDGRKGRLAVGCDADLVVFDPEESFIVEPRMIHHRFPISPYLGQELQGVVRATYLRGRKIYQGGNFLGAPGGRPVLRGTS